MSGTTKKSSLYIAKDIERRARMATEAANYCYVRY